MPEQTDHDLLIEMNTKLERAIVDIAEIKDGSISKIEALENYKVNKKDYAEDRKDHESRIRRLEYSLAIATGMVMIVQLFGTKIINALIK